MNLIGILIEITVLIAVIFYSGMLLERCNQAERKAKGKLKMRTLLIDDVKTFGDIPDEIARTFDDGLEALKRERWGMVMLDHDLGNTNPKKTGYDLLCYIRDKIPMNRWPKIKLVTNNPVGRQNMIAVLGDMEKMKQGTAE